MRVVDHRWPWMALAAILFAAGMSFMHFMTRGISEEFGLGFAAGAIVGMVIVLTAVGWRRGELRREGPS